MLPTKFHCEPFWTLDCDGLVSYAMLPTNHVCEWVGFPNQTPYWMRKTSLQDSTKSVTSQHFPHKALACLSHTAQLGPHGGCTPTKSWLHTMRHDHSSLDTRSLKCTLHLPNDAASQQRHTRPAQGHKSSDRQLAPSQQPSQWLHLVQMSAGTSELYSGHCTHRALIGNWHHRSSHHNGCILSRCHLGLPSCTLDTALTSQPCSRQTSQWLHPVLMLSGTSTSAPHSGTDHGWNHWSPRGASSS